MQNRWIAMVLIVSLVINAAFVAAAGYGYFYNRNRSRLDAITHSKKNHHFYEMLDLSQTQLKKITPMAESFHERLNHLYAEMEIKKKTMIALLSGEKTTEDRIEALRREMANIQSNIQKTVIAHILDVKAILNAHQRELFFDLLHASMTHDHHMFDPAGAK
jgi:Spy/CpxP family protein refolding chaperone